MKPLRPGPRGAQGPGLLDAQGVLRDLSAHVWDLDRGGVNDVSERAAQPDRYGQQLPQFLKAGDFVEPGIEDLSAQHQRIIAPHVDGAS